MTLTTTSALFAPESMPDFLVLSACPSDEGMDTKLKGSGCNLVRRGGFRVEGLMGLHGEYMGIYRV